MNEITVQACTPQGWAFTKPIVDMWPFKPLAGHARLSLAGVVELANVRVREAFSNPHSTAWLACSGQREVGFAVLSTLGWDSEQLGMEAARLDYLVANDSYAEQHETKKVLLGEVMEAARVRGIKHLSARLDAADLSGLHVLEEAGFITVDSILTFARDLTSNPPETIPADCRIRLATPEDTVAVAALAREAYSHDRFHSDPAIADKKADELHAVWISNSCAGKSADAVIIAEDDEGLLGYVTCKLQRDTQKYLGRMVGTIVLVATSQRARGRGVGQALTMAALNWFQEHGASLVEVGTQLRNIPASRLYQRCGFTLVGSSTSLRKTL